MNIASSVVLGADGGGTKTLGILADAHGNELARRQVGPGNPNVVGIEGATANLLELVAGCCERAKVAPSGLSAAVFGLAGVAGATVRDRLAEALRNGMHARGWGKIHFALETDARVALEGAFGGGPGVVVIAGTGSNLIGKLPDGRVTSVGGWGRILGDEGSAFAIGAEAIRAVARDIDGRTDAHVLRGLFAERLGWATRDAIIAAVYQDKHDLASLAPFVLEAAAADDPASEGILKRAASDITDQLGAIVARLGSAPSVGVVFVGGLIEHGTLYAKIVAEAIHARLPQVQIRQAESSPAQGAVLMALHLEKGI
jgi:N-acetylglucosamine kinase-like BadF-type ATPase